MFVGGARWKGSFPGVLSGGLQGRTISGKIGNREKKILLLISNSIYKDFLIIKWVKRIKPDTPNQDST